MGELMPRGKRGGGSEVGRSNKDAKNSITGRDDGWAGFLNLNLTNEEKEAFHVWVDDPSTDVWGNLIECLGDGLKLSIVEDAENDCYVATLTGTLIPQYDKSIYATSGRANTWEQAVALVLYKHVVIADKDWSNYRPSRQRISEV